MQVFSICVLYITFIFVVIECAQNGNISENLDISTSNTAISTTSITSILTTQSTIKIATELPTTLTTTNENLTTTSPYAPVTTTNQPIITTQNLTTTSPYVTTTDQPITTTEGCLTAAINVTVLEKFKTEVHLNVSVLGITNESQICPTKIDITCNADDDERKWVIQSRNFTLEINNTISFVFPVGNFSENTNYTCVGNDIIIFSFQTEEEVPSSPAKLNVSEPNSTSFTLIWEEPYKIPSTLQEYRVNITGIQAASENHFYCFNGTLDKRSINTREKSFSFKKALADFEYHVTVEAKSNVGFGEAANLTINTLAAASAPPENVTFTNLTTEYERNVDITQQITWDMPCDTNGPVNEFVIEVIGYYLYNWSRTDSRNDSVNTEHRTFHYAYNLESVWAASNYTVRIYLNGSQTGNSYVGSFLTDDNYPSAPKLVKQTIYPENFTLTWNEPTNYPGNITNYIVSVTREGVNWEKTDSCNLSYLENYTINTQLTEYTTTNRIVPDAIYYISVSAETSKGQGNSTNTNITSNMTYPDPVLISRDNFTFPQTEDYNVNATIWFLPGCFNGEFSSYVVKFIGTRKNADNHTDTKEFKDYKSDKYIFDLRPEYTYNVYVTVSNQQYNITSSLHFTAPAGVPKVDPSFISTIPVTARQTDTSLTLKKEYFNETQGTLRYLAIIISDSNITGGIFSRWEDNSVWPIPEGNSNVYYQATPPFWEPFNESDAIEYIIGNETFCSDDMYCNKPLEPGKQYFVLLRIFNDDYFRNTMPMSFITEKTGKLGLILGLIFGILGFCTVGFVGFILWKKRIIKNYWKENQCPETEISKKKFVEYCTYLEQNPDVLKSQWNELENKSNQIYEELPNYFSTLLENRRKNRYTNILPFDHSRVKLNIDEDDEICSDYINASYIKGFSNENEYIATQGPLSGTCRDFWKMILQEQVSIIVMVAKFIENNKDKCFKYFPNNRETMTLIGDDIEVRCSTELHFGFYYIRTLQVKKELKQVTVTHMQYLDWPDFGVPSGTENMLHFCQQFRERWSSEGGMAVIHCSAGVGRTGTLIATDILLRAVNAGRKIDVFNTVLELRRQRKSMVQTEKQYMYIYQLIKTMLECPIADEEDCQEHLYENVEIRNKNRIVESAL